MSVFADAAVRKEIARLRTAAVLDIGSSKIVCLCGSIAEKGGIVVHGVGVCHYDGFRDGAFENREQLREAIVEAVRAAEQESRLRIREVAVAVPGAFSRLVLSEATVEIENRSRRITAEDIDAMIAQSLPTAKKPADCVLMHSTPVAFTVNGEVSGAVPEGIRADELSGLVSHMYVQDSFVAIMEEELRAIGVEISMCVSAQLAEALLLIPEKERVRPAVLVDVGYTTTDVSIIENAALIGAAPIGMGGMQFMSDLSFALDIPADAAEQTKRRYVFSAEPREGVEMIHMLTGVKRVERSAINLIMESRAAELMALIGEAFRRMGIRAEAKPCAYVSGGGFSMMHGAQDYMRRTLKIQFKRDMPWVSEYQSPTYTSAFGALDFVLKAMQTPEDAEADAAPAEGFFNRLKEFFK